MVQQEMFLLFLRRLTKSDKVRKTVDSIKSPPFSRISKSSISWVLEQISSLSRCPYHNQWLYPNLPCYRNTSDEGWHKPLHHDVWFFFIELIPEKLGRKRRLKDHIRPLLVCSPFYWRKNPHERRSAENGAGKQAVVHK